MCPEPSPPTSPATCLPTIMHYWEYESVSVFWTLPSIMLRQNVLVRSLTTWCVKDLWAIRLISLKYTGRNIIVNLLRLGIYEIFNLILLWYHGFVQSFINWFITFNRYPNSFIHCITLFVVICFLYIKSVRYHGNSFIENKSDMHIPWGQFL